MDTDDLVPRDRQENSLSQRSRWLIAGSAITLALILSLYAVYSVQQLSNSVNLLQMDTTSKILEDSSLLMASSVQPRVREDEARSLASQQDEETVWPLCDCSRTTRLHTRGIITYDTCLVDTTNGSMDILAGTFTTGPNQAGIYQITFTAKYVAHSNGRFGAWSDVYVNDKVIADSQREYNGNARTESSTHTVLALHVLKPNDTVRVQFNKDGGSFIHSDSDHDVHFTVVKIANLPKYLQ